MDNVLETNGVPLTVFGGAVPELAPEDLPEGASPYNQDVDYNPGSVFTRGGRLNQIVFGNLFVEDITQFAQSVAGPFAPNEAPWSTPSNAQVGVPGTYTIAALNVGGSAGAPAVDQKFGANNSGATGSVSYGPFTPQVPNEYVFSLVSANGPITITPNDTPVGVSGCFHYTSLGSLNPVTLNASFNNGGGTAGATVAACSVRTTTGAAPTIVQTNNVANFNIPNSFASPVANGHSIIVGIGTGVVSGTPTFSVTDDKFNVYTPVILQYGLGGFDLNIAGIYICQNVQNSPQVVTVTAVGTIFGITANTIADVANLSLATPEPISQILRTAKFQFNIPTTTKVLGMQLEIFGNQNTQAGATILTSTLTTPGATPVSFTGQLPLVDGAPLLFGTPTSDWGLGTALNPTTLNTQTFSFDTVASALDGTPVTFEIFAVKAKVFLSPSPPPNINYLKTYEQVNGNVDTIVLDSNGVLWDESATSNPGVLNSIFTNILPKTFAKSVSFADIEYIAFSNLVNGTDVPRQWNSTNLDRISMVGPGAAPAAVSSGGSGGSNLVAVQSITQAAKVQMRRISWGASINAQSDSTPGNVLVISLPGGSTHGGNPPLNMNVGDTIVLSNITNPFPLKGGGSLPYNLNTAGPLANGAYTLLSSGTPIIGGGETDTAFTLQAPAVQYGYSNDFGVPPTSNWFYQDCVATLTTQAPLPNVGPGSTIQIAGSGGGPPAGYDGSYTVLTAPNSSSMTITQVVLVGGFATFSFTLVGGSAAPQINQLVSTANVLNGSGINDPNIFNFLNKQITAVTAGTFTVALSGPDIPTPQIQTGATAQVAGNKFTFDPGQIVNSGNPVSGGNVVQQGLIATGIRKVCYSFLTRSGYITQPSPIAQASITTGSGGITVSGLATGPPNVVARIVSFTGANGANFFYIPQTVNVSIPGQPLQVNTSTIVNDNTSTSAVFSFTDAVLLSATAIDIPGNNLFNDIELGSCRGLLTYAQRMIAWSEQAKITNLRNWSFDGGTLPGGTAIPLGWTSDPTSGAGGSLNTSSPVFGWAYQINNTSGSTQAAYGMITQKAYQDEFGVAIVQPSTLYSVRITAQCQPVPLSGNLVVDLFSPGAGGGTALGTFSIPLASMTTGMQIYTGTLLTNILQPVPADLVIRIWAQNIPNNTQILIDRVEPFPTLVPVLSTAFKCSYVANQEAFDLVTGVCGPAQNTQPINGGAELFDLLYALKEKSWYSTFDNGVTEPNKWNWKEVSNKVGTIGIHSYDWGEGWMLSADRTGVHFFEGGEPIKVSQEIQPLWDLINWQYGYTIWVRNDPEQRRFTVGIPIPTPNIYMPEFPVNLNPTSPNVILMCNYRELNTGAAMAQTGPIRSTYTGRLMSPEPARKWSFWNILCPYSDYIDRGNNQWPQWFGTGYFDGKIFALQASQLSDDGNAINSFWISYGFVKPEAADAKGLGLFRMEFPYFTVLATGTGTLNPYVYPESPQNRPYVLDPTPLPGVTQGDLEIGVNIKGQRFFVRVGTNAVGSAFRLSKMVVPLIPDSWSPIRGTNVITA